MCIYTYIHTYIYRTLSSFRTWRMSPAALRTSTEVCRKTVLVYDGMMLCVYIYIYIYRCVYIYIYIYILCVCIKVYKHVCMYMCVHIYIYIYIHICICMYIHIYMCSVFCLPFSQTNIIVQRISFEKEVPSWGSQAGDISQTFIWGCLFIISPTKLS